MSVTPIGIELEEDQAVHQRPRLRQTRLFYNRKTQYRSTPNVHPAEKNWGNNMRRKKDGYLRICYCNINGLDTDAENNVTIKNIRTFLKEKEVDVFGASEVNINWKKCQGA